MVATILYSTVSYDMYDVYVSYPIIPYIPYLTGTYGNAVRMQFSFTLHSYLKHENITYGMILCTYRMMYDTVHSVLLI